MVLFAPTSPGTSKFGADTKAIAPDEESMLKRPSSFNPSEATKLYTRGVPASGSEAAIVMTLVTPSA